MNDVKTIDANLNIAAVVFMKMDNNRELVLGGEKPYFYLNIVGAKVGDYCLVGSTGWNLVRVLRTIDVMNVTALGKVTQPLLSVVNLDMDVIREASKKLLEFQLRTSDQRLQKQIDIELMDELDREIDRVSRRRRNLSKDYTFLDNDDL